MSESPRHAGVAVIERYFEQGVEGVLGIPGAPPGEVVINPGRGALAVRCPAEGDRVPEVVRFQNVTFDVLDHGGDEWHQVSVLVEDQTLDEVYALLCSIIDRVQLGGESFANATDAALESLAGIVAVRRGLTVEKQVGLFGELLTLLSLTHHLGSGGAVDSWRGPGGEEHDFGFGDSDVEVKTTLSERRQHRISTATQLMPTGSRPLFLLSLQLTTAPQGSGWSLPELIGICSKSLTPDLPGFEDILARAGFRHKDEDLYRSKWILRSAPAFFLVDHSFPALTQQMLDSCVPMTERISEVSYRVDLTGLPKYEDVFPFHSDPPPPMLDE